MISKNKLNEFIGLTLHVFFKKSYLTIDLKEKDDLLVLTSFDPSYKRNLIPFIPTLRFKTVISINDKSSDIYFEVNRLNSISVQSQVATIPYFVLLKVKQQSLDFKGLSKYVYDKLDNPYVKSFEKMFLINAYTTILKTDYIEQNKMFYKECINYNELFHKETKESDSINMLKNVILNIAK